MLGGLDPIVIFNFTKLAPDLKSAVAKIPIVSSIVNSIGLPPIPVYLSEDATGLFIDTEEKNIDIETKVETLSNGDPAQVNQTGLNNVVRITMKANKDSIGLILLSAFFDRIFQKVTSKEYSITYMHGTTTIIGAKLHSFAISQDSNVDYVVITVELVNANAKEDAGPPVVQKITGTVPL